ncbi:MAG: hypothetical protein B7Z57_13115 [Acidiphilium sp. 37-60-79]|nr:MAG: hypothetical protein B7Z57_13115 [Acidiphilium sp. 37-60-79]OZB38709.1 MAG: hypothetical protein B7X48_12035 [Acidiphilium sp. 34-60-192]
MDLGVAQIAPRLHARAVLGEINQEVEPLLVRVVFRRQLQPDWHGASALDELVDIVHRRLNLVEKGLHLLADLGRDYCRLRRQGVGEFPQLNGPPPRLSAAQQAQIAAWVRQGPDLERDGVVRWRCVDLQRRIETEFAVTLHETSISRLLRWLKFTRVQPRPYHPKKDAAAQDIFKKTSLAW